MADSSYHYPLCITERTAIQRVKINTEEKRNELTINFNVPSILNCLNNKITFAADNQITISDLFINNIKYIK